MSSPLAASRCTCCHICHTSLKTSRREFYPCSTCPTIICRQCVELAEQDWDQVIASDEWSCPRCCGDCPCKRCRNKVSAANSTPKSVTEKKKSHTGKRKRDRSTFTVFEDNAFLSSPKLRRTLSSTTPSTKAISSPSTFVSPIPPLTADDKKARIMELYTKNQQCLDYIARTERLLALIRQEQDHIQGELQTILSRTSPDDKSESVPLSDKKEVSLSMAVPPQEEETSPAYSSSDESHVDDFDDLHSSSADEYDGDSDGDHHESNNEREVTINLSSPFTRSSQGDGKKETAAKELAFLRSGTPLFM